MVVCNYDGLFHLGQTRSWLHVVGIVACLVFLSLAQLLFFASLSDASAKEALQNTRLTVLSGPIAPEQMSGKIDYLLDPTNELTLEQILAGKKAFSRVTTTYPDFGYTKSMIWLRVGVQNQLPDVNQWRIHFRENFKQIFNVYVVRASGHIDHVFSASLEDGFGSRPIPYPEMVAPLKLETGEIATVYVSYWSEGASDIAFGFETDISFATRAAARTAKNFLYYGMMLFLTFMSILALYLFRHGVFAAYTCNCIALLLYLMHADGVTFQYLWPNSPGFNSFASIPLGASIAIFAPNFARVFLNTRKYHPIIDKLLLIVIFGTLAMVVSSIFVDKQILKKMLILAALLSISLCTLSGIVAATQRFKEVRFFLIAWLGFLGAVTIMSMRHWLGIEISQDFQHDSMRVVMVGDAALMGLSIADRYNQLRQSRQRAIQASYEHENRNLRLLSRLSDLEKRHVLAIGQAKGEDQKIADTLHDLQQPLHALRLNIRELATRKKTTDPELNDVEDAFVYIEQLMSESMSRLNLAETEKMQLFDRPSDHPETSKLREVTDSVFEMFLADATEKGLDFRYYPPQIDLMVKPLPVMRVIANLVSNAIKYTDKGKILLCTRKLGSGLRVEIHDTGPGMTRAEFSRALSRHERLEGNQSDVEGHGLGLSIVCELAEQNGYVVEKLCDRSGGFSIGITFPLGPDMTVHDQAGENLPSSQA